MLYIAYVKARPDASGIEERSRTWWNDGARPPGLRTAGHEDIEKMVDYWSAVADLEVHPAVDLAARFRDQGMNVA